MTMRYLVTVFKKVKVFPMSIPSPHNRPTLPSPVNTIIYSFAVTCFCHAPVPYIKREHGDEKQRRSPIIIGERRGIVLSPQFCQIFAEELQQSVQPASNQRSY